MAASAGCDAVKFQKRTIDIVYSADILKTPRDSPWGKTTRAQKEALEFGKSDYDTIDAYCKEIGIIWLASAWDFESQLFLQQYNLPYNKVASAMATHIRLLELIASEKKHTFLSVGMCTYDDIDIAVQIFRDTECPLTLMHTVSSYPSSEEELNLLAMQQLRERYGLPVGYSGHEVSVSPSLIAATLGATVLERHITLDRAMYGSDQSASLERRGLETLVSQVRRLPLILGDGVKRITEDENLVAKKLRYWTS